MARKSKSPQDLIAQAAADAVDAPDLRTPREHGGEHDGGDEQEFPQSEEWDRMGLGPDAPVQPLGHLQGTMFVLDHAGQLRSVAAECRNGEMQLLFGGEAWLRQRYPLYGAPDPTTNEPRIKGFDHKKAQSALIWDCSRRGLFNPEGRTRGRGAHKGPSGELLMHCGDQVWQSARRPVTGTKLYPPKSHPTGLIGKMVFPTASEMQAPAMAACGVEVARDALALINEWKFTDPVMAELVLSWIILAPIGGALDWRPHLWIVGPSGAGKTTLQTKVIRPMLGDWGVATEDATEAGLRQALDQDTLGVMFDEFEPDEGNANLMQKVLKLVRGSSSGAETMRGSTDHKAKKFVARSCFMFSSIQYVAMDAQDRNRMAIVQLSKIPSKKDKIRFPSNIAAWGDQLRRRWLELWPRWADTLQAYQTEMFKQGFTAREQDTYGTLLAAGDMMLFDGAPDPLNLNEDSYRVVERVKLLGPLLDQARGEAEDTTERCLRYLCSYRLPSAGGREPLTISRWIEKGAADIINGFPNGSPSLQKLMQHGIKLVLPPESEKSDSAGAVPPPQQMSDAVHVAIAPKDFKGVAEIFDKTLWQNGVWTQALAGLEGARPAKKCRFGGGRGDGMRVVTAPISHFIDLNEANEEAVRDRQRSQQGA